MLWTIQTRVKDAKGLVAELAPPHAQSVWEFRGEMIQVVWLKACCNYFSKKRLIISKFE